MIKLRDKLTNEDKENIMTKAFKQFGIDEHIVDDNKEETGNDETRSNGKAKRYK